MARSFPLTRTNPRARASVARSTAEASNLAENEVVFVQRTGPRILTIQSDSPMPLGTETLNSLRRGKLAHELAGGKRIAGSMMMTCPDIEVEKNGSYTLKKKDTAYKDMKPITVHTLDVWTGQVGEMRHDVDIKNLNFYSLNDFELPSHHSWKDHDAANSVEEYTGPRIDPKLFNDQRATGKMLDLIVEEGDAAALEKISNDPEEKLRNKPFITPSDEAWEEIEEFFRWVLEEERKKETPEIYKLVKEVFNEAQSLLLIPTALTSLRAQVQEENTIEYHKVLKTTFAGKADNLVTKFSMLCFGLPIAPITLTNIKYAGGEDDIPGKVAGDTLEEQTQTVQTIMWSEKQLEFLDVYHTRGYGHPTIRTKKRPKDAIATQSADDPPELDRNPVRHKLFPWKTRRFGCGQRLNEANKLHLRGGGGNFGSESRPDYETQRINVYTEIGRFEINGTYEAFHQLITRIFRTWARKLSYHIDILQDGPAGLTGFPEVVNTFNWTEREIFDQNQFCSHIHTEVLQDKHKLRVRYCGHPQELYEPNDFQLELVEIFLEKAGVAYWYLPMNHSDVIGPNQYQDTFRNAIECLLPYHRQYVVRWKLGDQRKALFEGRLVLAAEAPSKDLWDKTLQVLEGGVRACRYRITIEVVPKKDLVSSKKTQFGKDFDASKGELMVIVPGSAQITKSPILGGHDHAEFLDRIRKAVRARTSPRNTAIRVWSGPENYCSEEQTSRYVVFPSRNEKGDSDILVSAGIFLTADAVVARPEFRNFRLIDAQDESNSAEWEPQKVKELEDSSKTFSGAHHYVTYYSLDSFQKALTKLWPDYHVNECAGIVQSKSHDTFVIAPEMTEHQWRLQVFDWLDNENVTVHRNLGTSMNYNLQQVKGPLGVTYSAGGVPRKVEKRILNSKAIPNRTSETAKQEKMVSDMETPMSDWNEWVKKQDQNHHERIAAYTSDPSIFRRGDGEGPDISIFGQPFEQSISVGTQFPTIFTQVKTPGEVIELQRDNRRLENIVLDRIQSCQMCSSTFSFGPFGDKFKREHLQEHMTALREFEKIRHDNSKQELHPPPQELHPSPQGTPKKTVAQPRAGAGRGGPKSGQGRTSNAIDPDEDQKNIPYRLKEAHPGKNFYCPVCYKLLGKQTSPCSWHRQNCQVFGHERWLIVSAEEMKKLKATVSQDKSSEGRTGAPSKRSHPHDPDEEVSPKRQKQVAKSTKAKAK